jgi:hypothetical protein
MNDLEHIGTFSLGTKVMVSDPCYKLNTWCQGVLENVKSGIWDAYIKMIDTGMWGVRVAELIAVNSEHCKEHPVIMYEQQEFEVGVDSGTAGIFDYDYYAKYHTEDETDERWYSTRIFDQFFPTHDSSGWENSIFTDSEGVASSSGYGDGGYDCYVARNYEDKKIIGIKIVYIIKEETSEENDD